MISENKEKRSLLGIALFLLVLFSQWGFVFHVSRYANTLLSNILILFTSFLFLTFLVTHEKSRKTTIGVWWEIYAIITIVGYIFSFLIVSLLPWVCYFVLILYASRCDILKIIPVKLLFWSGVIAMFGIYLQFFFPSLYSARIESLFINDFLYDKMEGVIDVTEMYGMKGFFHNQGNAAIVLTFGFLIMFYLKADVVPVFLQRNLIYGILVLIIVFSIFFTGKRTLSLLVVAVPFAVSFLSSKNASKRFLVLLCILVAFLLIYYIILPYVFESFNFFFFHRLQETLYDTKSGDINSLTSGRYYMWDKAIDAWSEHPIFGIGVGKFMDYTRSHTDVHNSYLQVLCEQGLFGFAFYLTGLLTILFYTIRLFDKVKNNIWIQWLKLSLASQLIFLFYSFTGNPHLDFCMTMMIMSAAITIRINYMCKFQI